MNIIICDDDKEINITLEQYLKEWFTEKNMDQPSYTYCESGEALLSEEQTPDIVFLDVEMDGISGIDTGQRLKERFPDVIIFMVTSYIDYLDDAMRFHVFRYLTKPVEKDRLYRNLEDAMEHLEVLRHTRKKIEMKTDGGVTFLDMSDIVYIEAREQRTFVYTREKEYRSWNTLQEWIAQLDMESFFQPHRSYLVNLEYVNRFDKEYVYLCDDQYKAYLAARKAKAFKEAYFKYMDRVW